MTERIVVVLPDPFGPRKPTTSPSPTVRDTSSRATVAPNRFETFRTSSMRRNLPAAPTDQRAPRPLEAMAMSGQ